MKKHLFFDDNKLFSKENVTRSYGRVELVSKYRDPIASTDFCTGWVFALDGGGYRMLYFGHSTEFKGKKLFSAYSCDGISFEPEALFDTEKNPEKSYSHEIMDIGNSEIAFIYEDKYTDCPDQRYKMLRSGVNKDVLRVDDTIYVSGDLINWRLLEDAAWGEGAEPLASVFYNKELGVHTVIERPYWGIRCSGYRETRDFRNYSEFRYCLNVDPLDGDLAEIYGTFAFEYDGNYIGIAHIYHGFGSGLHTKYKSGVIDVQLAYSTDGRYWHRGLRETFISGTDGSLDKKYNLIWVNGMQRIGTDVYLYASASELEHGPAFSNPGTGEMLVFRMREDSFMLFKSLDASKESVIATREKLWHGGELAVNIKANRATVAVYSTESEKQDLNVLGIATPLEGYSHEDCIEFSGDSTAWVPEYKSGKRVAELVGKTLVFEIRFDDGEIYSLGGDYTDIFNVEGAVYRGYGKIRI